MQTLLCCRVLPHDTVPHQENEEIGHALVYCSPLANCPELQIIQSETKCTAVCISCAISVKYGMYVHTIFGCLLVVYFHSFGISSIDSDMLQIRCSGHFFPCDDY